jgi:hypothetical protein
MANNGKKSVPYLCPFVAQTSSCFQGSAAVAPRFFGAGKLGFSSIVPTSSWPVGGSAGTVTEISRASIMPLSDLPDSGDRITKVVSA